MPPFADARWRAPVFRVGPRTFTWLDICLDAMVRGDWDAFDRHVRRGQAVVDAAERDDAWPEQDALDEAATAFRYARDLLTTEETEGWLSQAGLDLDTWSDVLTRDVLRAAADADVAAVDVDVAALDAALVAGEGICSGTFAAFATATSERAALAADQPVGVPVDSGDRVAAVAARWTTWLAPLPAGDRDAALATLVAVDHACAAVTAAAMSPEALAAHLDRARLDWLRVDLERLVFDTAESAREAAWCVREDGLTLSEVAIESHQPVIDDRTVLDTLPEALRTAVLSASPDELVGPVEADGQHHVALVVAKHAPRLDDPLVRARAEASVRASLRSRAALDAVTWIERPR